MSNLLMPVAGPAAHKLPADTLGLAQRSEAMAAPGAFAQALRHSSDAMKAPAAPATGGVPAAAGGAPRREAASDPTAADAAAGSGPGTGATTGSSTGEVSNSDAADDSPRTRGRAGARRAGGDGRRVAPDRIEDRGTRRAGDRSAVQGDDETATDLAGEAGAGTDAASSAQEGLTSLVNPGQPMNPADGPGGQADGLPGGQTPTGTASPSAMAGGLPLAADAAGAGGSAPLAPEATAGLPKADGVARTPAAAGGPDTGAPGKLADVRPDRTAPGLATAQRWRSAEIGAATGALPGKAGTIPLTPGGASTSGLRSTGTAPDSRTASLQQSGKGSIAVDPAQADAVTAGTPSAAAATPTQSGLPNDQTPTALASQADNGQRETGAAPTPQGAQDTPAGPLALPAAGGTALPSPPTGSTGPGGRAAATGIERTTLPATAPAAAGLLRGSGDSARAEGPGPRASSLRRGDTEAGPGQRSARAADGPAADALLRDPAGLATAARAQGQETGTRGEGAGAGQAGTGATNTPHADAPNGSPGTGSRGAESFQALLSAGPAAPAAGPPVAASTAAPLPSVWLATPMHSPEFSPALGAQITMLARGGVQEARIELNPAEMGPITVRIAIQAGGAQVDFQAEQAATRQVIEASLPNLAGALRDAGLTLTGGGVFEPPPPATADTGFSPASGQGQSNQTGGGDHTGRGGDHTGRGGTRHGLAGRQAGDADPLDRGTTTVLQPGTIRGLVDLVA